MDLGNAAEWTGSVLTGGGLLVAALTYAKRNQQDKWRAIRRLALQVTPLDRTYLIRVDNLGADPVLSVLVELDAYDVKWFAEGLPRLNAGMSHTWTSPPMEIGPGDSLSATVRCTDVDGYQWQRELTGRLASWGYYPLWPSTHPMRSDLIPRHLRHWMRDKYSDWRSTRPFHP